MDIIDFLIGATLMNTMPHFVLGVWQVRMLSGFGYGTTQNIAYGLVNFVISVALFLYKYGPAHILENGIYAGAFVILVIYLVAGRYMFVRFHERYQG